MIEANDISIEFQGIKLFEHVNIRFTDGNCYGIIGANGSGKSTFLKVLSGEIEPSSGSINKPKEERISTLKQDHFQYEKHTVLDVVFMGHEKLYKIMHEKETLYAKPDDELTAEENMRLGELEGDFAELNGWEAESEAALLLNGLGIKNDLLPAKMLDLTAEEKVKVLLAQAIFGEPDILLLDEPTNHLNIKAIMWLENFLLNYKNTVLVVSHDRHFLNKVCTHIADIDFLKIQIFAGNYDFWKQSSELALKLQSELNKKAEDKANELKTFIQRFSANASKSKQATSRKKLLDKITLDNIKPSSRKYPYIGFTLSRTIGKDVLIIENLTKSVNGIKIINDISLIVKPGDKIAFVGSNDLAKTTLFEILIGKLKADSGSFKWGETISPGYFPKDNNQYFLDDSYNLIDWLRLYSENKEEQFIRGFLGRMLFSGDNVFKKVNVLSGGEKMRLMYSRLMIGAYNLLLIDGPTEHLDLESICSVNKGFEDYAGNIFVSTQDHVLIQATANRIIELTPKGLVDYDGKYDDYLENPKIISQLEEHYRE